MYGARRIGFLGLALSIGLVGCAYSEEIDGTSSSLTAELGDVADSSDPGIAPATPAFWEEEDVSQPEEAAVFQPPDGRVRPRCRVVLHWCDRPGDDPRGECQVFDCDWYRGHVACTTLAWQVCGTAMPPFIY